MTRFQAVPGTLYFQSPEQENQHRSSCSSTRRRASPEVEFFEDFYIDIFENDTFALFKPQRAVLDRGGRSCAQENLV